jgi:hypothetical protein
MFFSSGVRQRRTENPLRERLLVRKFILQLESYFQQQQLLMTTTSNEQMETDQVKDRDFVFNYKNIFFFSSRKSKMKMNKYFSMQYFCLLSNKCLCLF